MPTRATAAAKKGVVNKAAASQYFNADPDPAVQVNADPDPDSADQNQYGSGSETMCIAAS